MDSTNRRICIFLSRSSTILRAVAHVPELGRRSALLRVLEMTSPVNVDLTVNLCPRVDRQTVVILVRRSGRNVRTVENHISIHRPGNKVLAPFERVVVPAIGSIKGQIDRNRVLFAVVPNVHPADLGVVSRKLNVDLSVLVGDQEEGGDLTDHVRSDHVDRVDAIAEVFLAVDQFSAGIRLQVGVLADCDPGAVAALVDLRVPE